MSLKYDKYHTDRNLKRVIGADPERYNCAMMRLSKSPLHVAMKEYRAKLEPVDES